MKYTEEHLNFAVKHNIITEDQKNSFINLIKESYDEITAAQKFLFYSGALLVISALSWLLGNCWIGFGHVALLIISLLYFFVFLIAGYLVNNKTGIKIAGNLLYCISIATVPLATYALLQLTGIWRNGNYSDFFYWIRGRWVILEAATIAVSIPFLIKTKFSFIMFLVSFSLWFLSMDITDVIYKHDFTWTQRAHVSEIFGFFMILCGYIFSFKKYREYGFWLYLFGLITLTFGSSIFYNSNKLSLFILFLVSILMCAISIFLDEKVFIIFGALNLLEFLSRLSCLYFFESPFFPFVLTLIGILIIAAGIILQKNRTAITLFFNKHIPQSLNKYRLL